MDIARLKEFLNIAETLSFTKTSRNMNISQSALSRHISELEREVGNTLLERTTTQVSLTPAGRTFYERAVTMVRDYEGLMSLMGNSSSSVPTTLRVSGNTMQPFSNRLLFGLALRSRSGGIPVRFDYHKTRSLSNTPPVPAGTDMLDAGEVDLVVEVLPFDAPCPLGFEGVKVCYEPFLALCSDDCPLVGRPGLALDDLRGYTPIAMAVYRSCPDMELAPFQAVGMDAGRAKTVFVQNMLEIPEKLAAMQPDEVALLEREFCESYRLDRAGAQGVRVLDVADDRMRFSYWLLRRKNETRPAVFQAFDLLEDMMGHIRSAHPDRIHPDGTLWADAF